MFNHKTTINVKALTCDDAAKKAKQLEIIGQNIDLNALEILAKKSEKKGMSDKVRRYASLM